MNTIHKKLPGIVSGIHEVGQESKELFFTLDDAIDFSYYPGQFIMLEIPEPRQDESWKIITPKEVWDMLLEREALSRESLLTLFPLLEERTLEGILQKLLTGGNITQKEDLFVADISNAPESKTPPFQRAYSMASCPDGGRTISTMVKATPNGFMSKYLTDRLTVGERVLISGPLGKFCFTEESPSNVLLISAGSGITPLMSVLRYIHTRNLATKATLLYSNKTPESIIYRQELATIEEAHPSITITHTITRPETSTEEWTGATGRIDKDKVEQALHNLDKTDLAVYICGPLVFGKSMKELLLSSGVEESSIHMEAYG